MQAYICIKCVTVTPRESIMNNISFENSPRLLVGYARVSTEDQGATGYSLDLQKRAITTFAEKVGCDLIDVFSEVASAKDQATPHNRPQLFQAMRACRDKEASLVVFDWSRLSRNKGDQKIFCEQLPGSCKVFSIKEEEDLADAFKLSRFEQNQHQREIISENTKVALQKLKASGVKLGNPNILDTHKIGTKKWYEKSAVLGQQIEEILLTLPEADDCIFQRVATALNERNIRTGHGKTWTASRARKPVEKALQRLADQNKPVHTNALRRNRRQSQRSPKTCFIAPERKTE